MLTRRVATFLLILLSACSGGGEHPEETIFRVGAPTGLAKLIPGDDLNGSSAAAADLVFDYVHDHASDLRAEGNRVVLTRKATSRFSAEELAASVRYQGVLSARALDPEHIEIVFRDAAGLAGLLKRRDLLFDVGPFKVESEERGYARLRGRGKSAIDVIEIVEISSSDEWRKLVARELDVLSSSPTMFRDQFVGMSSVRLIDIVPSTTSAALYFNVRDPALHHANVRRRIAAALNRPAIARIAGGDASSAAPPVVMGPDEDVVLPARLSVVVLKDESPMLLAASVLRHQLDRLHIVLDVESLSLEEGTSKVRKGEQQLVLSRVPNGRRRFDRFLSPVPGGISMTGFSDPEYDAAVAAGDLVKASSILDREMPATVLYEWRMFAAIDSRFCGDVTPSYISWRWMADLYPCEDGEGEGKDTP